MKLAEVVHDDMSATDRLQTGKGLHITLLRLLLQI